MSQSLDETEKKVELEKKKRTEDLFKAIEEFDPEKVLNLLKQGVLLETVDERGYTPLLVAASDPRTGLHDRAELPKKRKAIVKMLIDFGANINYQSMQGRTALHIAIKEVDESPLFETARLLLEENADVNICDKEGNSPLLAISSRALHVSLYHGISSFMTTIDLLIAKGANVNQLNHNGNGLYTDLIQDNGGSLYQKNPSIYLKLIDTLIKAGLNSNYVSKISGWNAFHYIFTEYSLYASQVKNNPAFEKRSAEILNFVDAMVPVLIKNGVDLHLRNKSEESPVEMITCHGDGLVPFPFKTLAFIMNHVSLDKPLNQFDDNAFKLAARYGNIYALQVLIARKKGEMRAVEQQQIDDAFLNLGQLYANKDDNIYVFGGKLKNYKNFEPQDYEVIFKTIKWFLQYVDSKIIIQKLIQQYYRYFMPFGVARVQAFARALMTPLTARAIEWHGLEFPVFERSIAELLMTELISRAQIEYLVDRTEEDLFFRTEDVDGFSKILAERISDSGVSLISRDRLNSCKRLSPWLKSKEELFLPYRMLMSHPENKFRFSRLDEDLKYRIISFLEEPYCQHMESQQELLIEKRLTWIQEDRAKRDKEKQEERAKEAKKKAQRDMLLALFAEAELHVEAERAKATSEARLERVEAEQAKAKSEARVEHVEAEQAKAKSEAVVKP